jgi:hypothetical protein
MNLECTRESNNTSKQESSRLDRVCSYVLRSECSATAVARFCCCSARVACEILCASSSCLSRRLWRRYIYIYIYRTSSIHVLCKLGSALKRDLFTSPKENVEVFLSVWKNACAHSVPLLLSLRRFRCPRRRSARCSSSAASAPVCTKL